MADHPTEPANRRDAAPAGSRLDSWKEIAAYLQRDVTTVRRWEKRERLAVHRHVHDKLGTVYAFKSEIDEWWLGRGNQVGESDADRRADEDDPLPDSLTTDNGQTHGRERLAWVLATTFLAIAVSFPAGAGQWQVSSAGGGDPRWRRDGRELFYIAADGILMSVLVETDRVFRPAIPQPLFDTKINHLWDDARNHYDVSLDGQRFLVATPIDTLGSLPLTVAVNWRIERP